ncbi:AT-rich interactive domain-containing protein 5B-like isoform X2 [Maniola hyperantus]|uniref:AT-rich interactive domain-containing protein 5B-like isoform X2 n=1 Tax=Aphantopus hyperantus TaxID=2795564 RepID=UPI003749A3D2
MEKPSYKLVGTPCGQHGQYTFYKAIRLTGPRERIYAIGDFFFVRIWQDSELVSIGELQLLWTDRVSDQTLVSVRLYCLPENTPDGRGLHGEDEVLAINDKVVLRAEDLLSWVCSGAGWRWGLRAVWRGACAPPAEPQPTAPLHHTKLDFSDVDREKSAISVDVEAPGVVVFSYPRYCRYRALLARLEGIQADWLRDSLVAALGGYAAPTKNTRILYCKDTFEYPELEGHEFVCNHLAPKLKGRPRGRRRRAPRSRSRSRSPDSRSSDSEARNTPETKTPRRLSLRNGPEKQSEEEEEVEKKPEEVAKDKAFEQQLKDFFTRKGQTLKISHSVKNVSLRSLYVAVVSVGGYEAACRGQFWRRHYNEKASKVRRLYERYLLQFEHHERWNGRKFPKLPNGKLTEPKTIDTIDVTDSPVRDIDKPKQLPEKRLRTPSPKKQEKLVLDNETGELLKEELNITSKPAEELNREFLDSLPPKEEEKAVKIFVKPVEKLIEPSLKENVVKIFEENTALMSELTKQKLMDSSKSVEANMSEGNSRFLNELAQKLHLGNADTRFLQHLSHSQSTDSLSSLSSLGDKYTNGHTNGTNNAEQARPAGRSSLRAVRVKPTRPMTARQTPPVPPPRSDSASSSPTLSAATTPLSTPSAGPTTTATTTITNFGIHHPPPPATSDDDIVEVPYQPKSPEIIDLDEYPESPQGIKKKKLEILKERGLEVTAVPPSPVWPPLANPITPLINPNPIILNPAVQHQILTQAQMFQMYNIIPNYPNGVQAPKVIQASSAFGNAGPEKTVYGNPKDPFMPPPHVLQGTPIKPQRSIATPVPTPQDILDLTCKTQATPSQKPAVEIVRIPSDSTPSPSKTQNPQNLSKNYTILDGKAVVSNLEITLVNPKSQTPPKKPPQKRSSNGKFASLKTPTPPKDYPKSFPTPSPKKPPITVPSYQITKEESPSSSTQTQNKDLSLQNSLLQNVFKNQNLAQMMEMQKVPMAPLMDPLYMQHIYSSLGQMDQRQLAMYRDFMTNQFRGYTGLLNMATPTTKN